MNSLLYQVKDLKKVYGQRTVLDLKELSLERGRIQGLMGPNGAGKTTLLEILALLLKPSSGEIWFEGQWIDANSQKRHELRRKIVLVQQQPILFTTTVAKNVVFPLRVRKFPREKRDKMVRELLELVGMWPLAYAKAHTLSGGETQRVAMAQALACSPEVILLDEPTASVDAENQFAIEQTIREINREKSISVIFTTHDLTQSSRLADESVFLFEGKSARSIYENIFGGQVERGLNGSKVFVIKQTFKLCVQTDKVGPVQISIDPRSVSIGPNRRPAWRDNAFMGTLIQLSDEKDWVRALVDVGIPMNVLIPKRVFKDFRLGIGEQVWLHFPPERIHIF